MSESIVQRKLAKLIQQEMGDILRQYPGLPSGSMVSISVVRVTADLGLAKIYITVLPDSQLEPAVNHLNDQSWDLRHKLSAKIRNKARKMPEVRFYADDSFREAERIDALLEDIIEDEE